MTNGSSTASASTKAVQRVVDEAVYEAEPQTGGATATGGLGALRASDASERTGVRAAGSMRAEAAKRVQMDSVDDGWDSDEPEDKPVGVRLESSPPKDEISRLVKASKFPSAMEEIAREEASCASKLAAPTPMETSMASQPVVTIEPPSASKLEAVTAPSVKLQAARTPQESLLSLEADHVVEFFSSAPPAVARADYEAIELEFEARVLRPRSSLPPAQLRARQQYFRRVVAKVMVLALLLFAFTVYVLWQRGFFAR